ncbi:MAG: hypothetical protein VB072_11305 [Lentimicrobium sp.]|nr:hypothetical protein [Lentimicrobium sp.]MEA5111007.1 hypothetical protein [Lentimicrobium sp.]
MAEIKPILISGAFVFEQAGFTWNCFRLLLTRGRMSKIVFS